MIHNEKSMYVRTNHSTGRAMIAEYFYKGTNEQWRCSRMTMFRGTQLWFPVVYVSSKTAAKALARKWCS